MSATSPSSALGRCVVCGKESLKGCSKCKAAGLDWMYFCSVDHQRLIWKVHKRVCGESPFRFPLLNGDEARASLALQGEAFPSSDSEGKTWSEAIVNTLSSSTSPGKAPLFKSREEFFEAIVLTAQIPGSADPVFHDDLISRLRASIVTATLRRAPGTVSSEEIRQLLLEDPFGVLAKLLSMHIDYSSSRGTYPDQVERDWRSELKHRLLILIARLQVEVKLEENSGEGRELSGEQLKQLKPLMEACDLIPTSNPNETNRELLNEIMFDVFGFAGYRFSFDFCRERMSME